MRGITELLFGRDAERLLDQVLGASREERDMAARAEEAGDWCGSTPRAGSAPWRARAGAGRRGVIIRGHDLPL